MTDAEGHLNLANATQTEQSHLATTTAQIQEWDLSIATHEANLRKYQDGIEAERDSIKHAKDERAKLRRKRIVFKRAVFALELIEQEG